MKEHIESILLMMPAKLRAAHSKLVVRMEHQTEPGSGVFFVKIKGLAARTTSIFTARLEFYVTLSCETGELFYEQDSEIGTVVMKLREGIETEYAAVLLGDAVALREYNRLCDKYVKKMADKSVTHAAKVRAKITKKTVKAIAKFKKPRQGKLVVPDEAKTDAYHVLGIGEEPARLPPA